MCLMLGNKYLLDSRFRRAKEEYYRCYRKNEDRADALLLALFCCAKMGDLREARSIVDTLIRKGVESFEVRVPSGADESYTLLPESFIESGEKKHNILLRNGKLTFILNAPEDPT